MRARPADADRRVPERLYPDFRCAEFSTTHSAAAHRSGREYAVFAPDLRLESLAGLGSGEATFLPAA